MGSCRPGARCFLTRGGLTIVPLTTKTLALALALKVAVKEAEKRGKKGGVGGGGYYMRACDPNKKRS